MSSSELPIKVSVQLQNGDQHVSATPAALLSDACQLGYQFLLGRCESNFPDLAEFHMLLSMPEIVIVLHG